MVLNDPLIDKDDGCAYGDDEIHLGNSYTSNFIMMAIMLHEFSHCMIARRKQKKNRKMSIFTEEVFAWSLAIEYQQIYFNRAFTKSQGNFMLDCLKTYSKQHYQFTKGYLDIEKKINENKK